MSQLQSQVINALNKKTLEFFPGMEGISWSSSHPGIYEVIYPFPPFIDLQSVTSKDLHNIVHYSDSLGKAAEAINLLFKNTNLLPKNGILDKKWFLDHINNGTTKSLRKSGIISTLVRIHNAHIGNKLYEIISKLDELLPTIAVFYKTDLDKKQGGLRVSLENIRREQLGIIAPVTRKSSKDNSHSVSAKIPQLKRLLISAQIARDMQNPHLKIALTKFLGTLNIKSNSSTLTENQYNNIKSNLSEVLKEQRENLLGSTKKHFSKSVVTAMTQSINQLGYLSISPVNHSSSDLPAIRER